ncbi:hypothetical protein [Bradyrhizobium iriomotense]|nr:hypothetical protein [Bradyrhizobium iriomotense]
MTYLNGIEVAGAVLPGMRKLQTDVWLVIAWYSWLVVLVATLAYLIFH